MFGDDPVAKVNSSYNSHKDAPQVQIDHYTFLNGVVRTVEYVFFCVQENMTVIILPVLTSVVTESHELPELVAQQADQVCDVGWLLNM